MRLEGMIAVTTNYIVFESHPGPLFAVGLELILGEPVSSREPRLEHPSVGRF